MKKLLLYLAFVCFSSAVSRESIALQKFYIGGLFPNDIEDIQDRAILGTYPETAIKLAIRQINEAGLLTARINVSLELLSFSTSCRTDAAVHAYLQLIQTLQGTSLNLTPQLKFTPPYVLLGPACNQPSYFTAALSSRYLKDIQVSYSANTPLLSNIESIPLFYRTVPSYSDYGRSIYALMKHFDWLLVGVIHQEVAHYTRSLEDLNSLLTANGRINEKASVIASFGLNSYLTRNTIMSSKARIFIAMVPENRAAETICAAYKMGMTGEKFQWILLGDYQEQWWLNFNKNSRPGIQGQRMKENLKCTSEEMLQATESILILSHNLQLTHHLWVASSEKSTLVLSEEEQNFWWKFATFYNATTGQPFQPELASRVMPAYDAMWTVAHALKSVLNQTTASPRPYYNTSNEPSPNDINYSNNLGSDNAIDGGGLTMSGALMVGRPVSDFTRVLNAAMERTDFMGTLGRIHFDTSSHSIQQPLTYILQIQSGHIIPIGIHSERNGGLNLTYYGNELTWQGSAPPRDRLVKVLQSVSIWTVGVIISITILGIAFAISILIVNCVYRKHKVVKASSPYLNFVIALGCIMGFLSIIFMSMESLISTFKIDISAFPFFCNIRLWFLTISFTFAFGALFAKTWRIYVIFRNPWMKKRPYKDRILFMMVAIFLLFDLIILILWAIVDPLKLVKMTQVDRNAFVEKEFRFCVSQYNPGSNISFFIWMSIVTIPKSLLLVFGVFLVVQTSKIKAKFFRDAKFTGIAIFGFVMACGVGVPVAFSSMFLFQEDLSYITATSTILICCYLILLMVFIPKFVLMRRYKKMIPSAILIGLNPSFRIRRQRLQRVKAGACHGPPMSYYANMLRGKNNSVISTNSCSSSSSSSSSDGIIPSELPTDWSQVGERESIGWESAFEDDSDGQLVSSDFEYMARVGVTCRSRKESADTILTVNSADSFDDDDSVGVRPFSRYCSWNHRSPLRRVSRTCDTITEGEEFEDTEGSTPHHPVGLCGTIAENEGIGHSDGATPPCLIRKLSMYSTIPESEESLDVTSLPSFCKLSKSRSILKNEEVDGSRPRGRAATFPLQLHEISSTIMGDKELCCLNGDHPPSPILSPPTEFDCRITVEQSHAKALTKIAQSHTLPKSGSSPFISIGVCS